MQSSACSETGQPSASASRKISSHSDGRFPAPLGIGEADAVGGNLEMAADRVAPASCRAGGAAARCARPSSRAMARACWK